MLWLFSLPPTTGTGARGLRAIFEKMLMKAMLDVPGGTIYEVKVTVAVVEGRGEPEYVERSADDPPVPVPGAATGDAAEDEEDAGAAPLYARSI